MTTKTKWRGGRERERARTTNVPLTHSPKCEQSAKCVSSIPCDQKRFFSLRQWWTIPVKIIRQVVLGGKRKEAKEWMHVSISVCGYLLMAGNITIEMQYKLPDSAIVWMHLMHCILQATIIILNNCIPSSLLLYTCDIITMHNDWQLDCKYG